MEASYEKMWHWLAAGGIPGIFKSVVCEYTIFLPSGKVKYIPGLAGCMSWTGVLDMKYRSRG